MRGHFQNNFCLNWREFTVNYVTDYRLFDGAGSLSTKFNFEYQWRGWFWRLEFGDVLGTGQLERQKDGLKFGFAYEPRKNQILGLRFILDEKMKRKSLEAAVFSKPMKNLVLSAKVSTEKRAFFFAKYAFTSDFNVKLNFEMKPREDVGSVGLDSIGLKFKLKG